MDLVLFSPTLPRFQGEINNPNLLATLNELSSLLNRDLVVLSWNDHNIAVPLTLPVQLPPLGNHESIDIRAMEPVTIVFNLDHYPYIPPKVHTDRTDFPKNKLAHLYVAIDGKPPGFCLVRGNRSEWYSNKQIKDLITRAENWLQDAATGELIEDGNQFDPIRLEGYSGTMVYDYDQFYEIVEGSKSFQNEGNFAVGLFVASMSSDRLSFKLEKLVTLEDLEVTYAEFLKEYQKKDPDKKYYVFGYIVWSEARQICPEYSIDFPKDWSSFKLYCSHHGIELAGFEELVAKHDLNEYKSIPIICGIKRPKPIIGFSGDVEFMNFTIILDSTDVEDGKINDNTPMKFHAHNQPLTLKKATDVSGFSITKGTLSLVVGCGALGSKIVMHLARGGTVDFLLADPDEISSHNLVRHALYADSVGMNKSDALKKEIQKLYPYEKINTISSGILPGENWLKYPIVKTFRFILDFSASNSFFHSLIVAEIDEKTRICKAYISDHGNLGILLIEGENRNPRIDDLQIFLYAESRTQPSVSSWLNRELNSDLTTHLTVGVGCNSETVVLSDDVVSLHGAFFSGIIKTESQTNQSSGKIYLNEILNTPYFHNVPREISVPEVTILQAHNDPTWQIRIFPGILEIIKSEMQTADPDETGGVFLGRANFKTKTIHVVELVKAPNDSEANEVCFFRGVDGLSEAVEEINVLSGNQLGYIGEWHSHPHGPEGMSCVDDKTVQRFKKEFSDLPSPLPVFLMIVTSNGVIPYVY